MQGNVAFITGAASGIGRATARALAAAGVRVAMVDYQDAELQAAAQELERAGAEVLPLLADLTQTEGLAPLVQAALDRFGRIDFLVNSAAQVGGTYEFLQIASAEWDRAMLLNVKVPMLLMQLFARHVMQRGGGGGRIVNVTSSSAFRAQGTRAAYGSSKAALTALTRIVAAQFGEHDINVNAVAPGITNTPGAERAMKVDAAGMKAKVSEGPNANFFKRLTEAEDVAATIVFLCSPGSRQITGQTIHVSAGTITP
ncbi:MAG TPA: SDR family oxidoreductase [Ramlibacter sp.]|nr:SDR family oxidoreductase [Ramlibacter sp.]